jgi:hypothetical protein
MRSEPIQPRRRAQNAQAVRHESDLSQEKNEVGYVRCGPKNSHAMRSEPYRKRSAQRVPPGAREGDRDVQGLSRVGGSMPTRDEAKRNPEQPGPQGSPGLWK